MELDKKVLGEKEYIKLEKKLFDEMYRAAGRELVKMIFNIVATRKETVNWFYTPIQALGNKSPYDYCNSGKRSEIIDILGRLEHGVYS